MIKNKESITHTKSNINDKETLLSFMKDGHTVEEMIPIIIDENLYDELIKIINTEKSTIKYACSKIFRLISEQNPQYVYPFYFEIASWLNHPNNFIKWDAIYILSNLAIIDKDNNFSKIQDIYFNLIKSKQMITAANAVGNCWKFVIANPELDFEITKTLLEIPKIKYMHKNQISPECNRIVCGKAIEAFYKYFDLSDHKYLMIYFVQKQLNSTRKSVVKLANKFLKDKKLDKTKHYLSYTMIYEGQTILNNLKLRNYSSSDYTWYRDTCNLCFKSLREELGLFEPLCQDKDTLQNLRENIYIFEKTHQRIGSVSIYENEIDDLFIDSKYQGKGYGKELLLFAIYMIQQRNKSKDHIKLRVLNSNVNALRLYLDCEFRVIETRNVN